MEIRRRVNSGIRAIAVLVVSITITVAVLAAVFIDALAPAKLSASASMHCLEPVQPVLHTLELVEDC
ncbi:MAG TPA: hypothetical protein VJR50_10715 [Mycobacterium sp.]|jgi:hypothetical protein|nr:hypothetical protein [Mycobacterium sp.]